VTVVLGTTGEEVELRLKLGASFAISTTMKQPGIAPINLTGARVFGGVRRLIADRTSLVQFDVAIGDPLRGHFTIALTREQIASLVPVGARFDQRLYFDLYLEDAAGTVRSLLKGRAVVELGVVDG
jgi:hypothetical protein